ncbi:MAG: DUF721 domain-containing protein [Asticcacaulis sp.]
MKRSLPSLEESLRILRSTHTRRAPRTGPPVQKQVQPLLKSLQERFEANDDGSGKLKGRWTEIVGQQLAKLCEPVRIVRGKGKPGTLEIRVGGAYAPLIQHQSAILIDRVNLYLGTGTVDRLRLVQGPLSLPQKPPPPARPRPLNAAEELCLREQLAGIEDERLKASLLKLGRAVLQKQKNAP